MQYTDDEILVLKHWKNGSKIAQYRESLPNMSEDAILEMLKSVMLRYFIHNKVS